MGCHFFLQGIFLIQQIEPAFLDLLHWKADSSPLSQAPSQPGLKLRSKRVWYNPSHAVRLEWEDGVEPPSAQDPNVSFFFTPWFHSPIAGSRYICGLPQWLSGKESTCQFRRCRRHRFDPLGWEDALEESTAPHSNILAWEIPWTEKPGGPQSMGLQRFGHDLGDWTRMHGVFVDKENSGFRYTFATLRMRVLCYSPEQEAEETVSGGKNPWIQSGWKKSCFSVLPCRRRDSAGRGCHWLTPETICLETPQFTCWLILHPTSIESFHRFLKVVTNALYVPSIKTWS